MKHYNVSYVRDEVPQAILIKAQSEEQARRYFESYKPDAKIYGVTEQNDITEDVRKGKPIITAK